MEQELQDKDVTVTCLVFLSPKLVALIYQKRYSVELFFRFFKQILGMRHLLSQRVQGVEIQVYCAVIACLIIQLQTGRKPDKRTVEMGLLLHGAGQRAGGDRSPEPTGSLNLVHLPNNIIKQPASRTALTWRHEAPACTIRRQMDRPYVGETSRPPFQLSVSTTT